MIGFLLLSLPTFGVVGLGWVTIRAKLGSAAILDSLGWFSFRFALPALVFRLIASQPIGRSFNVAFYGGYLMAGSVVFGIVFLASVVLGRQALAIGGARATAATVSNLGFLGPPLMLAFFGERGAGPLAMAVVAEVMVLLSFGSIIMGSSRSGSRTSGFGLRGVFSNPVLAAIVLGAGFAAAGLVSPSGMVETPRLQAKERIV